MDKLKAALAEYQRKHKMTGLDMAEKLGVDPSVYSRWRSGRRDPSPENIRHIADRLRVPVGELL